MMRGRRVPRPEVDDDDDEFDPNLLHVNTIVDKLQTHFNEVIPTREAVMDTLNCFRQRYYEETGWWGGWWGLTWEHEYSASEWDAWLNSGQGRTTIR